MQYVPFSYVQKARKNWWKYKIAQYFQAYKPIEIEQWDAETILEHLGAIQEIEKGMEV